MGILVRFLASVSLLPLLVLLGLIIVAAAPFVWATRILEDLYYCHRFRAKWRKDGKFILFVYSNSPNWQTHVEERILPMIEPHAVVLNWSERKRLKVEAPLEFNAFRLWAGDREFNPIAIVVPERGRARRIRFWQPFRDLKHGKPGALQAAEERLRRAVETRAR